MTAVSAGAQGAHVDWPWRFLALITDIPAHAWDAITPRGRVHESLVDRFADVVGVLSHRSPPHEAVLGARMLQALVAAAAQGRGGGDGVAILAEVDVWCVAGWPRRWPRPEVPDAWDDGLVLAGAALAAARLAADPAFPGDPRLRDCLADAAHRLAIRAVEG